MPEGRKDLVDIDAERAARPIGITASHDERLALGTRLTRTLWCWLIIGCFGCGAATPLPAPTPPPPPPPVVEAPPPPPKCEKVEEGCVAGAETRARIGQIGWQFAPPATWTYAQGEELTIATSKSGVMGVAARQAVDAKKERAEREEALRLVAGKLGVTLPKKKSFITKKPDKKKKVGDVDVEFYQFEGAKLDGRTGPLLFFVARASNEQVLVGAGFVSDDDGDDADRAIMTAIESLGPTASDAATASEKTP
jgi:hypothetical protein